MTMAHVIILLATGIGVGFASGLLGVGGAFIMTPVQYMIYTDMGFPTDIAIKLAFGTSLLVILPISLSGGYGTLFLQEQNLFRWHMLQTSIYEGHYEVLYLSHLHV